MQWPKGAVTTMLLPTLWAAPVSAQTSGDRELWWHPAWGWEHMMFGGLMMVVFWGAIIALIVLLVRWLGGAGAPGPGAPGYGPIAGRTPIEILRERFAKGEIDQAEFEERKLLLSD